MFSKKEEYIKLLVRQGIQSHLLETFKDAEISDIKKDIKKIKQKVDSFENPSDSHSLKGGTNVDLTDQIMLNCWFGSV